MTVQDRLLRPKIRHFRFFRQNLPSIVFKYRSWRTQDRSVRIPHEIHQRTLRECELYFASPGELNDPLDCNMPLPFHAPTEEFAYERLSMNIRRENPHWLEARIDQEARLAVNYASWNSRRQSRSAIASCLKYKAGILSLSGRADEPTLWHDYADEDRGYCIGVDMLAFEKECEAILHRYYASIQVWPVVYEEVPPKHDLRRLLDNDSEMLRLYLSRKTSDWKHEAEVRAVLIGHSRKPIVFRPRMLTHLILGMRMAPEEREEILQVARDRLPHAILLQAKAGPKGTIDFDLI